MQNKHPGFVAPLTSFDWNEAEPRQLGTCSIDTTCTIWDVERGVVDTQVTLGARGGVGICYGAGDVWDPACGLIGHMKGQHTGGQVQFRRLA